MNRLLFKVCFCAVPILHCHSQQFLEAFSRRLFIQHIISIRFDAVRDRVAHGDIVFEHSYPDRHARIIHRYFDQFRRICSIIWTVDKFRIRHFYCLRSVCAPTAPYHRIRGRNLLTARRSCSFFSGSSGINSLRFACIYPELQFSQLGSRSFLLAGPYEWYKIAKIFYSYPDRIGDIWSSWYKTPNKWKNNPSTRPQMEPQSIEKEPKMV